MTPSPAVSPFQRIQERKSFTITELADTFGITVQAVHQWLMSKSDSDSPALRRPAPLPLRPDPSYDATLDAT